MQTDGLGRNKFLNTAMLVGLFLAVALSACVPAQEEEMPTEVSIDVTDSLFQQINNWQDERNATPLYELLYHPNPNYRYLAVRALANMPEALYVDTLARLLKDPVDEVRGMTAFALGQTKDERALSSLTATFAVNDTAKQYVQSQKLILGAVGQCGDLNMLNMLSGAKNYSPTQDTALLEGQARGIFNFGLRSITSLKGTQRMVAIVTDRQYPESVQLIAATYLGRVAEDLSSFTHALSAAFESNESPYVRMALALALGKTKEEEALTTLIGQYEKEADYRVKCNILRALSNFPYENTKPLMMEAIRSNNAHIAQQAVSYLLEHSSSEDATLWWRFAKDGLPSDIEIELYQVANRHLPAYRVELRNAMNAELRQKYKAAAQQPYRQAAIIRALGEFAWNFRNIYKESQDNPNPIVKTAAIETLAQIAEREDFERFFGLGSKRVTLELARDFTAAIQTKLPGAVASAAIALRSEKRDFKPYMDSVQVYEAVLQDLELPAMIESYNELAHTIAYLKGEADSFKPIKPTYNHPINWKMIDQYGDRPTVEFMIKGKAVTIELWADVAPATVANFLHLANTNFFEGKAFHRVVPNFVVQGGSPTGDAYGSLDYSIRSECSPISYNTEGLLGMASAGKDTEGTQFFITHSPTLHLDGAYTIFGRVQTAMDAVHQIQQGDTITSVKILQ